MKNELYNLISELDAPIDEIAEQVEQTDKWLLGLLSGEIKASADQKRLLAKALNVTPNYLDFLLKDNDKKESIRSKLAWLIVDKVIIGLIVLSVAVGVQWHYENYAEKRQKAVAASSLYSDYIKSNYRMFQSSFVSLLSSADSILGFKGSPYDNPENRKIRDLVLHYETEVKVYIELLKLDPQLTKAGEELVSRLSKMIVRIKSLSPNASTLDARKELVKDFTEFSQRVQDKLIKVSQEEVENVL